MLLHPQEMQQQYEQYQALCRQLEAAQQQSAGPPKPCGRVCSFTIKANNGSPSTTAI